jgi:hypothetical protein
MKLTGQKGKGKKKIKEVPPDGSVRPEQCTFSASLIRLFIGMPHTPGSSYAPSMIWRLKCPLFLSELSQNLTAENTAQPKVRVQLDGVQMNQRGPPQKETRKERSSVMLLMVLRS